MAKVVVLQGTGSPHWTGFPSTSGQNSGTFVDALRGTLRGGEIFWNFKFLGVPVNKELLTGTAPVNNFLLTGTVPVNNFHLIFSGGGVQQNLKFCWVHIRTEKLTLLGTNRPTGSREIIAFGVRWVSLKFNSVLVIRNMGGPHAYMGGGWWQARLS